MTEQDLNHGVIKESKLRKMARRAIQPSRKNQLGGAFPFNWTVGYDSELFTGKLKIKDQGRTFSCGGQAASRWLEIASKVQKGITLDEQSAKSIYSIIDYPGGGTTVGAIQRAITKVGAVSEAVVPSYDKGQLPTEAFITDETWRTKENIVSAMSKIGWVPQPVETTIEAVAEAMRDTGAVIIEFAGFNNGTWFTPYPRVSKETGWRHFICSKSAETSEIGKQVSFYQSWGESAGNSGIQHFTEDWFTSGKIEDAFTFVPEGVANPNKETVLRKLINLWSQLLSLVRQ